MKGKPKAALYIDTFIVPSPETHIYTSASFDLILFWYPWYLASFNDSLENTYVMMYQLNVFNIENDTVIFYKEDDMNLLIYQKSFTDVSTQLDKDIQM